LVALKKNPVNNNQGWGTHPSKVQGKVDTSTTQVDTTQRKNKSKQSTKIK
jgi:hypothetical protein